MILEAAKVREPRSELNPGVWQGNCFVGIGSVRIARKCFGDRESICRHSGGQILIALMIARKFRIRRLALHAFPMRRGTGVRNRPDKARRRLFRLGRDRVEFERCCLTRRRGGAEIVRLRSEGSRWGGRLTNAACGGYRNAV